MILGLLQSFPVLDVCSLQASAELNACAGAREVVLLDREPLALQCGLLSAAASGVHNVSTHPLPQRLSAGTIVPVDAAEMWHPHHGANASQIDEVQALHSDAAGLESVPASRSGNGTSMGDSKHGFAVGSGSPDEDLEGQPAGEQQSSLASRRKYRHRHRRRQHMTSGGASLYEADTLPAAPTLQPPALTSWARGGSRPQTLQMSASANPAMSLVPIFPSNGNQQYSQPSQEGQRLTSDPLSAAHEPKVHSHAAAHMSAEMFDWSAPPNLAPFDVILACDVLYEDFSVEPLARLMPGLLSSRPHARVLLADPVNRTPENRQRFLQLLAAKGGGSALNVEETSTVEFEFRGSSQGGGQMPVVLTMLRRRLGGDTVGVNVNR